MLTEHLERAGVATTAGPGTAGGAAAANASPSAGSSLGGSLHAGGRGGRDESRRLSGVGLHLLSPGEGSSPREAAPRLNLPEGTNAQLIEMETGKVVTEGLVLSGVGGQMYVGAHEFVRGVHEAKEVELLSRRRSGLSRLP